MTQAPAPIATVILSALQLSCTVGAVTIADAGGGCGLWAVGLGGQATW